MGLLTTKALNNKMQQKKRKAAQQANTQSPITSIKRFTR